MPIMRATDVAYIRLRSPDLDLAEEFLTHFGLLKVARTSTALYMRGSDTAHHIHITEKGDPRYLGCAYYADNEDDLAQLARASGASGVESLDEPGGGKRVRLTDPNGCGVEVVHGLTRHAPIVVPRQPINTADEPLRRRVPLRLAKSPTLIKRIAHVVLAAPDVVKTVEWYREHFGLLGSDEVYAGDPDHIIGSFNRFDRGDTFVDHHALFVTGNARAGLHHVSFEVPDVDAVFLDHDYLRMLGKYEHFWGVGRHVLGSQVFDYWLDPWGRMHEHWADTDRLNASTAARNWPAHEGLANQWGAPAPERIKSHVTP